MRLLTLFIVLLTSANVLAEVDFRKQVYPLLHDRCFKCHQGADAKSGVRLDLHSEVLSRTRIPKGDTEPLLIQLVTSMDAEKRMPQTGKALTADEVNLLREWIKQGVTWDETLLPSETQKKGHWAFQTVVRPPVPKLGPKAKWGRNAVDDFIAVEHERLKITPAKEADRRTLIRRLSFDLVGLPPTPEEVEAFIHDRRADAYEQLVERLLESPQYGERWGRHWLDLARYADSEGYESDFIRPHAWRYRDWVVNAFNDDKPYDAFILEQLAGDEVTPYRDANLIATGFLAAARFSGNEEDKARQLNDMYVDIVNATGNVLLGLTVQCAQCHDHKFDPLSQKDYYRLQGFFLSGLPYNFALRDPAGWKHYNASKPPEFDDVKRLRDRIFETARAKVEEKTWKSLTAEQTQVLKTPNDQRTPKQHAIAVEANLAFQWTQGFIENSIAAEDKALYGELKKKMSALEAKMPEPPQTFGYCSPVSSPHKIEATAIKSIYPLNYDAVELGRNAPFVLVAGDSKQRGDKLSPGWPTVFGPTPTITPTRSDLAKWLTDPKHPLTARVWVNRIWQYHFGRGIVETTSDFGLRGAKPTHRELLDWLAAELMTPSTGKAWSTKHIHRLIVNSATYRQAAQTDAENMKRDPSNAYLSRWKPRRVEAEVVHDAMLAVSGELKRDLGGVPETDES